MNRKLVILLVLVLSVIFTFLLSQFGSNPFTTDPIQAEYMRFEDEDLTLVENGDNLDVYYYLPYLEENQVESVNLQDFIILDPSATNGKETLIFSIVYDNEEESSFLDLVETGIFGGRLTISGQTAAVITVRTTDGSGLSASLIVRPNKAAVEEHHSGDIFK